MSVKRKLLPGNNSIDSAACQSKRSIAHTTIPTSLSPPLSPSLCWQRGSFLETFSSSPPPCGLSCDRSCSCLETFDCRRHRCSGLLPLLPSPPPLMPASSPWLGSQPSGGPSSCRGSTFQKSSRCWWRQVLSPQSRLLHHHRRCCLPSSAIADALRCIAPELLPP